MESIGKNALDKMKVVLPRESAFRLDRPTQRVMVDKQTMIKLVGLNGKFNSDYFFLTYAILEPKPMKFDLQRKPEQYTLQWQKFCEKYGYECSHVFRVEVPNIRSALEICEVDITIPNYGICRGNTFNVVGVPEYNVSKVDWANAPKDAQFLHKDHWYKIYKGDLLYFQHDGSGWARSGAYLNLVEMFRHGPIFTPLGELTDPNQLVQTPNAADFLKKGLKHMEDRAATYDKEGGAERSMGKVVGAFNIITGHKLTEEEGWHFMELLKQVRSLQGQYKEDCYEDLAAYAALRGECAARERGEAK